VGGRKSRERERERERERWVVEFFKQQEEE
jgi:hypothetical protein